MNFSSVGTALELLSNASKALQSVREQAKTSKDAALKENISKLYDDFLDLKEVILRLKEEVDQMKAAQQRPPLTFRAPFYYREHDQTPFCQACYEGKEAQAVHLTKNADDWWFCPVCRNTYYPDEDGNGPGSAFGIVPMSRG